MVTASEWIVAGLVVALLVIMIAASCLRKAGLLTQRLPDPDYEPMEQFPPEVAHEHVD